MNLVATIEKDTYVSGLQERAKMALAIFDDLVHSIQADLDLAERYKEQSAQFGNLFGPVLEGLEINLDVVRGESSHKLSTLTLSSTYAQIKIFANHPPGWLFIQVSKRSAMFEGVLHYGVIEVVHPLQRDRAYDLNMTRCGWLWMEGAPDKDKISPQLIAETLWKHLLTTEIPAQLEEMSKKAER